MNSQNMMNGAPMEQQTKSKSNILIPVLAILGVHVILLGALLLQGCKDKPSANVADNSIVTNLPSITFSNPPIVDATATVPPTQPPTVGSTPPATTTTTQPIQPTTVANSTLTPPPVLQTQPTLTTPTLSGTGGLIEHKIESGESFATIAKKYGVSVDAIVKANPNVNPRRLQIGQVIKVPEKSDTTTPSVAATTSAPTTTEKTKTTQSSTKTASVSTSDAKVYIVKPGDNLTKISKTHGVTVRELKAANNLSTEKINVGQKLKIPVKNQSPSSPTPKTPANENTIDNSLPKPPPANV
ncbi:MAG: LysM peptidoglycan-binding domain-containing protein [Verrucomicrobiae bacterium]|nr:LysM peptidoglycan-binding domain-containing protein [Verrucomicrobiae bacterium]